MYMVQVLLPVLEHKGSSCGFYIYKHKSLQRCKDYADWHHMLTGHVYDVHLGKDPGPIYHTGVYNPKFLEGNLK